MLENLSLDTSGPVMIDRTLTAAELGSDDVVRLELRVDQTFIPSELGMGGRRARAGRACPDRLRRTDLEGALRHPARGGGRGYGLRSALDRDAARKCPKRPFPIHADRLRPRLDGGRQSCIDEPARGTYVSPRSRARPSVPANSGSAALMHPHTTSLVSVLTAVNDGRRRLNQFETNRMPTQRNP